MDETKIRDEMKAWDEYKREHEARLARIGVDMLAVEFTERYETKDKYHMFDRIMRKEMGER